MIDTNLLQKIDDLKRNIQDVKLKLLTRHQYTSREQILIWNRQLKNLRESLKKYESYLP